MNSLIKRNVACLDRPNGLRRCREVGTTTGVDFGYVRLGRSSKPPLMVSRSICPSPTKTGSAPSACVSVARGIGGQRESRQTPQEVLHRTT